ncbi:MULTISPECIES: DUF969 domain-containing protein [unclassified Granulicatella]|uniref:DUF969 domain-containing protein n=1 Tax=unclassified Granulicatella TaxID=2630493 RepID=UPI0010736740|nr:MULTISPECIES: DUF969 domain-containing protein [unclassified Granulicatella]MBF0780205.1 DUF969 domain-containing protein [Granulicatella sp. 19428wC4_WM01]TFU95698.1 DUF969 domain-containing protein [Granulicatella sp. WM01]
MEWIKLIGIAIIIVGFMLKLDTIATVVVAGLATALVSGLSITEFLELLGTEFVKNRAVTIFLITLPLIGMSERFGLKQRAVKIIQSIKGLTVGSFYTVYLIIRLIAGLFSIRLGGHPQFVRPLIAPMGEAAATKKVGNLLEKDTEKIKAYAAANENFGNFFGQNLFLGASGVLLINGTLTQLGYENSTGAIAGASFPIAITVLIVVGIYNALLDRKLKHNHKNKK